LGSGYGHRLANLGPEAEVRRDSIVDDTPSNEECSAGSLSFASHVFLPRAPTFVRQNSFHVKHLAHSCGIPHAVTLLSSSGENNNLPLAFSA
jgi:hypothetical protein